ncbi:MAG: hypothetical protein ACX94B_17125 [Henriciella sp.]
MLKIVSAIAAGLTLCGAAMAQSFPADYDIGSNSIRGGGVGEAIDLQITPYNAGKELAKREKFSVFERINLLSWDYDAYGDPLCMIIDPGSEYQRYWSKMVVVVNAERDERITRRFLWDEVKPVLEAITAQRCPHASTITAHVYVNGWDLTPDGTPYLTEVVPMPIVQLPPNFARDNPANRSGMNRRNRRAYNAIHTLVSEGMMVAHFSYTQATHDPCKAGAAIAGQNCTFDTFTPLYWGGTPSTMELSNAVDNLRVNGHRGGRYVETMRAKIEELKVRYERDFSYFDGYVSGVQWKIEREKYIRERNMRKQEALNAWNDMLTAAMEQVEKQGLIGSLLAVSGSGGGNQICATRVGSLVDSCLEDALFIPGYL